MKTAIITGVNGQDGSYLSELLLNKGYKVIGLVRRSSVDTNERINHLLNRTNFVLLEGDITDSAQMNELILDHQPDEVYNLAAQSHVATSFKQPVATWNANASGTQNILEAIRKHKPNAKFYQASTSEMFGSMVDDDGFQRETTLLSPNSPYAIAKVAAHHMVRVYREAYGMFACSGILFNHESPRRGDKFVTRKITRYIAKVRERKEYLESIGYSREDILHVLPKDVGPLGLGNLDAKRDWGYAGDYVEAMHLMLQANKPDDYVVSTGKAYSVREFLNEAFARIGIDDWTQYVYQDPAFMRPYEVPFLCGDSSKARKELGWEPSIDFKGLVRMMVDNERI